MRNFFNVKKLLLLFFVLLFHIIKPSFADQAVCKECMPDPNWDISEVSKWISQIDLVSDKYLRKPSAEDTKTEFGTLINSSCFKNVDKLERERRQAKLMQALKFMYQQIYRCAKVLRFPEVLDTIPVARRARISCGVAKNHDAYASFGKTNTANYDRTYEIQDLNYKYFDNEFNVEYLSSLIFHESLHWLALNNREWHNDAKPLSNNSCNKSVYHDRVYLLEALCFPRTLRGVVLTGAYGNQGLIQCPGLCEKAFTEVDKAAVDETTLKTMGGSKYLFAVGVKPKEAKIRCDRIRKFFKQQSEFTKFLGDHRTRGKNLKEFATKILSNQDLVQINKLFSDFIFAATRLAAPYGDHLENIKKMKALRDKLLAASKDICTKTKRPNSNAEFCQRSTNPFADEMNLVIKTVESYPADIMSLSLNANVL